MKGLKKRTSSFRMSSKSSKKDKERRSTSLPRKVDQDGCKIVSSSPYRHHHALQPKKSSLKRSESCQTRSDMSSSTTTPTAEYSSRKSASSRSLLDSSPSTTAHRHTNSATMYHLGGQDYQTVDQIEFMTSCLINDGCYFVHFRDARCSPLSEAIDIQMMRLAAVAREEESPCKYRRIDSRWAPFITAKLGISSDLPTVVAVMNGRVLDRISDFSPDGCCLTLSRWVREIEGAIVLQQSRASRI